MSRTISTTARLLGFAGLVPQLIAVLLIATGIDAALGTLLAFGYAVLIVSFLGGIWWGIAMQDGRGQPRIAAIAVLPTLVGFALMIARILGLQSDLALVLLGIVVMLTLLIDRMLVSEDQAPPGWMGLRVPLSLGLGALTILAGVLAPVDVALVYSS
ncbi:DUF3429 domain-containing protein [Sphingomonas sp.]|jgi:hypothetical protein|uniref:DUF3429 domain-containing protein n=1 Tax=Sphingomonas sp. TaxID=28214 RepID=UPI0035C86DD1